VAARAAEQVTSQPARLSLPGAERVLPSPSSGRGGGSGRAEIFPPRLRCRRELCVPAEAAAAAPADAPPAPFFFGRGCFRGLTRSSLPASLPALPLRRSPFPPCPRHGSMRGVVACLGVGACLDTARNQHPLPSARAGPRENKRTSASGAEMMRLPHLGTGLPLPTASISCTTAPGAHRTFRCAAARGSRREEEEDDDNDGDEEGGGSPSSSCSSAARSACNISSRSSAYRRSSASASTPRPVEAPAGPAEVAANWLYESSCGDSCGHPLLPSPPAGNVDVGGGALPIPDPPHLTRPRGAPSPATGPGGRNGHPRVSLRRRTRGAPLHAAPGRRRCLWDGSRSRALAPRAAAAPSPRWVEAKQCYPAPASRRQRWGDPLAGVWGPAVTSPSRHHQGASSHTIRTIQPRAYSAALDTTHTKNAPPLPSFASDRKIEWKQARPPGAAAAAAVGVRCARCAAAVDSDSKPALPASHRHIQGNNTLGKGGRCMASPVC
jgi:hypothetical protein